MSSVFDLSHLCYTVLSQTSVAELFQNKASNLKDLLTKY